MFGRRLHTHLKDGATGLRVRKYPRMIQQIHGLEQEIPIKKEKKKEKNNNHRTRNRSRSDNDRKGLRLLKRSTEEESRQGTNTIRVLLQYFRGIRHDPEEVKAGEFLGVDLCQYLFWK